MESFNIDNWVRPNIRLMKPYSTARHENERPAEIFLDANENSLGSPLSQAYNRYPDPIQLSLKQKISAIKGVPSQNIFLGNGSDEAIDVLIRIFCVPGQDNIIINPPTYGMYEVCAATNDIAVRRVMLDENFQPDLDTLANAIDEHTKIIFLCSPNNPTGNSINPEAIELILNNFEGIVVVDEAYINFSRQRSFISWLTEYPQLVIMQTFSKAWGLAALRLGMAFAGEGIIGYMNKVKYPYNINAATIALAEEALGKHEQVNEWTIQTVKERNRLAELLPQISFVEKVYPSDANFLLVKMKDAKAVYDYLANNQIIVRDRSKTEGCENCLRITIGTEAENNRLLQCLNDYTA
jgi:histidinol-phosphate aminotransferase